MKQKYQQPSMLVMHLSIAEHLLAASNQLEDATITFNQSSMETGDGNDAAVKSYSVWDDVWAN